MSRVFLRKYQILNKKFQLVRSIALSSMYLKMPTASNISLILTISVYIGDRNFVILLASFTRSTKFLYHSPTT
ncbi:MAG: hypothetical protein U7126_04525 [Microcoleus sp.]